MDMVAALRGMTVLDALGKLVIQESANEIEALRRDVAGLKSHNEGEGFRIALALSSQRTEYSNQLEKLRAENKELADENQRLRFAEGPSARRA